MIYVFVRNVFIITIRDIDEGIFEVVFDAGKEGCVNYHFPL
jgi:hypothetical protein